jgi:mono/diheme cytochrome c family protein
MICSRCHLENLGGQDYFSIPGMLTVPTPNLTRGAGGVGAFYTDEDWVRAVRHGVGSDGRGLFFMTSTAYQHLSEEDLGALIAYIKSKPPVDNELPERRFALVGRLMMGTPMTPPLAAELIDHASPSPPAPQPGVTAAYGEYLSRTCTECHGESLNGIPFGPPGQEILSPNLTPGGELVAWSEGDFIRTMRTGKRPDNRLLNAEMPWKFYGKMTDDELKAVWLYLHSLPALAHGDK